MKKITTWHPDTCDCILHYEWDDAVPQDQRIHTAVEEVTTHTGEIMKRHICPIHDIPAHGSGKHIEHHITILEENQRKNKVLSDLLQVSETLHEMTKTSEGDEIRQWKKGFEPIWKFDSSRTLTISIQGTTHQEKMNLKKIELKHNKVSIN